MVAPQILVLFVWVRILSGQRRENGCDTHIIALIFFIMNKFIEFTVHNDIIYDFPELTHQDIYACLAFAAKAQERTL